MNPPRIPSTERPALRADEPPLAGPDPHPKGAPPDAVPSRDVHDEVVLLDPDGSATGTADRVAVHGADTPLHLAFSLYLFDDQDRLLMTRRALTKKTWPGVWSNSCCGHPRPGERVADAVVRRTAEETGLTVTRLTCVLPDFAYRAVDASGVVENEICPVYVARLAPAHGSGALLPPEADAAEVMDATWAPFADVREAAARTPFAFSPWCVLQLDQLDPDRLRQALA